MLVLNIAKRPAKLGGHLNARTQKHGEESVGAIDLSLSGIMIGHIELNVLLDDDQAHEHLFRSAVDPTTGGALTDTLQIHPRFRSMKMIYLDDVFENAKVLIHTQRLRKRALTLVGKLKKIALERLQGGLTEFRCQFATTPDSDDVATLFDVMNKDIEVEIIDAERVEPVEEQPELPMAHSQEEQEEAEREEEEATEEATSGRGRKIQRAARKAAKARE